MENRVKRMFVLVDAAPYVTWGEPRARLFRKLVGDRSSYQIGDVLSKAGVDCSVAYVKKMLSGKAATVSLSLALSICETLSIDPYSLLPIHETIDTRNTQDPIILATNNI